jgi:hypothetical protein
MWMFDFLPNFNKGIRRTNIWRINIFFAENLKTSSKGFCFYNNCYAQTMILESWYRYDLKFVYSNHEKYDFQ